MKQYSDDSGTNPNKLGYLKLLKLLNDFQILDKNITKEKALLIYSHRCRKSLIDFGALVDILYSLSRLKNPKATDKREAYKKFIKENLMDRVSQIPGKTPYKPISDKVETFSSDATFDNEALRLFEGHDDLLKHVRPNQLSC